jgi:hypothetical protein
MRAQHQELVERNCPIEISSSLPASICRFAGALVENRVLAEALEVPNVVVENTASQLQVGSAQLADMLEYTEWLDWVAHWVARFSQISGAAAVSLRVSHSRRPTCPRFHVDAVRMRLIATLLGPGTEWLRPEDVVLSPDGRISQSPAPDSVRQMTPGSVGIFRGANFDAAPGCGVVHRSPPDRVDRVVMTLDIAA